MLSRKRGFRVANLSNRSKGKSQQETNGRDDSQALVLSPQGTIPGVVSMSAQYQAYRLPSNLEREQRYNNATPSARKSDHVVRDERMRGENRRPVADPIWAYKQTNNGAHYSVQPLLLNQQRKDLPAQNNSSSKFTRQPQDDTSSEPTVNHRSVDILEVQGPGVPRKEPYKALVIIDNKQLSSPTPGEPERPKLMERNVSLLAEDSQSFQLDDQILHREYDAVDMEDLRTFAREAWKQMVKHDVLLTRLNARDDQRLQISSAIEISHRLLWDEIKRLRGFESDLKGANASLAVVGEQHQKELEEVRSEQEKRIQQHLNVQSDELMQRYGDHMYNQDREIASLKNELSTKEQQIRGIHQNEMKEKEATWFREREQLRGVHQSEMNSKEATWVREREQLQEFHRSETNQKETAWSLERKKLTDDYTELKRAKEQELLELKVTHKDLIEEYKKACDDLLEEEILKTEEAIDNGKILAKRLREEHAAEKSKLETDIAILKETHDYQVRQKDEDHVKILNDIRSTHDKTHRELTRTHQFEKQSLIEDYENKLKVQIDEVHAVNKVLLTRDNDSFKPPMFSEADARQAPDEYVRAGFMDVIQTVDDLSRLTWKQDQPVWTEEVLSNIGAKQTLRLLKKSILQDTIWTIVHRHIFCSPFRMFGKEGRYLEELWNEAYGKDPAFDNGVYTWPSLDIAHERWRYMTLIEGRKALVERVPSPHDPRAKLKIGFKTAKDAFVAELKSTLDGMIEWSGTDASNVEKLAKRISNVWLEFGMYRCRFVIFFKGTVVKGGVEEKVKLAMMKGSEGGLELNVVPGLRRHGNVKGVELGRSTIVGGFEGECMKVGGESK